MSDTQRAEILQGYREHLYPTVPVVLDEEIRLYYGGGRNVSVPDPLVWAGDDVEVMIDADNGGGTYDTDNAHAQQWILNAEGTFGAMLFPLVFADSAFAGPSVEESVSAREGTVYTYEMALPGWDLISVDGTGDRHDFQSREVIGLSIAFGDFESTEDDRGGGYHLFNYLDGSSDAHADQMSNFALAPP